ncbi:MAG: dihydrofolate reductase [Rhodocyclaceae bacterium]|nr:dihydrofolate reductase [Rhodocyclaceae bacterium]
MSGKPEIVLIAAVARNGVIGRDNQLPWRQKADLQHFKATTTGSPILMGRRTWESLGRPLPGRRNLVVTRNLEYTAPGAEVFDSPDAALAAMAEAQRVFVIGGAELYRQMLDQADRLLITEIWASIEGDASFPPIDPARFEETRREAHSADPDNEHDFDFVEYRRRGAE